MNEIGEGVIKNQIRSSEVMNEIGEGVMKTQIRSSVGINKVRKDIIIYKLDLKF